MATTLQALAANASSDRFADQAASLPFHGKVAKSAARTATASWLVTVKNGSGLIVVINATAKSSSPSVVFTINGFDPVSGQTWTIATLTALTDVATRAVRIHPSTVVADCKFNDIVPEYVVITATHSNSDPLTYSIAAEVTP